MAERIEQVRAHSSDDGIYAGRHALISDCIALNNQGGRGITAETCVKFAIGYAPDSWDAVLKRFGGSYELALAAYNAGPNRVARWLETIGDPRSGKIDMVDWIEMIPFRETRGYVQHVMEGVGVYRDRLNGPFRTVPPAILRLSASSQCCGSSGSRPRRKT